MVGLIYPGIPEPTIDTNSIRESLLSTKECMEILLGRRGSGNSAQAVTWGDLTRLGLAGGISTSGSTNPLIGSNIYNAATDGGVDNTGATNAYTKLNAAGLAAAAAGKILYVPGTYDITGYEWRIPSNLTVVGDGPFRTIIKRTDDAQHGTVTVFNATGVRISGVGIQYTPGSFSLGYGETGFCVRNGSTDVVISDCLVTGFINRAYLIINSEFVKVKDCYSIGSGNAALRVVTDFNAKAYAYFTDETSYIATRRIKITGNYFTGATTLTGTTRPVSTGANGATYGINCTIVNPGEILEDIQIEDNTVSYFYYQGITAGASCTLVSIDNNTVVGIFDAVAGSAGTGILWESGQGIVAGYNPLRGSITGNTVRDCWFGLIDQANYLTITGNTFGANQVGAQLQLANYTSFTGNVCDSNQHDGLVLTNTSTYNNITGNILVGNSGWGVNSDGTCVNNLFTGNISVVNTLGAAIISGGATNKQSNNTW